MSTPTLSFALLPATTRVARRKTDWLLAAHYWVQSAAWSRAVSTDPKADVAYCWANAARCFRQAQRAS